MKLKTINYFYALARASFYLRWYESCKFIFNDRIFIRKQYNAQQIPIKDNTLMSSFNIYKNMNLDIRALSLYERHSYTEFKEFYHEVLLTII